MGRVIKVRTHWMRTPVTLYCNAWKLARDYSNGIIHIEQVPVALLGQRVHCERYH